MLVRIPWQTAAFSAQLRKLAALLIAAAAVVLVAKKQRPAWPAMGLDSATEVADDMAVKLAMTGLIEAGQGSDNAGQVSSWFMALSMEAVPLGSKRVNTGKLLGDAALLSGCESRDSGAAVVFTLLAAGSYKITALAPALLARSIFWFCEQFLCFMEPVRGATRWFICTMRKPV